MFYHYYIYLHSHFPTVGLISNDFPEGSLAGWAIRAVLQSFVDAASTKKMATFGIHRIFEARETYRALSCTPLNILNTQAFCALITHQSLLWSELYLCCSWLPSYPDLIIAYRLYMFTMMLLCNNLFDECLRAEQLQHSQCLV